MRNVRVQLKHTPESTAESNFENQAVKRLKWNAQVEEKLALLQHRGLFCFGQKPQTDPAGCRLLSSLKWNMALPASLYKAASLVLIKTHSFHFHKSPAGLGYP